MIVAPKIPAQAELGRGTLQGRYCLNHADEPTLGSDLTL